jgi:DNA-binding transcriptional regulator YbjK
MCRHYTRSIVTDRKYDPERRRQHLCDAAIELLASHGIRALTHRGVDKKAGLGEGTTSSYFRTRDALLRGVFARVADRYLADMIAWTEATESSPDGQSTMALAQLVMLSAEGPGSTLNKARIELTFYAVRHAELQVMVTDIGWQFYTRAKAIIAADPAAATDPTVLERQTMLTLTFLDGVFNGFARNLHIFGSPEELNAHIQSILRGTST